MDIIRYDELTFPEVAELPRDTPLLIPLGAADNYDWEAIADRVRERARRRADRLVIFPGVPFGFRTRQPALRSLAVEPALFQRVLASLVASIQADGFTRVFVVNGQGAPGFASKAVPLIESGRGRLARAEASSRTSKWGATKENRARVALIPTGHTEQHAFHLPLNTDTLIIDAIAAGVEQAIPEVIFRLPTWPYGVSLHRRQYPGTLTIEPRAWEDFWVAIIGNLRAQGFRMAYLINGHGGNHSFLVNVTKFAGDRWPDTFAATAYLHTASGPGAAALTKYRTSKIGGMGHAGELETSYILHLRPDLVHMQRAADEIDFTATPNYYMDWLEGGALIANPPWTDDTLTGAYGAATQATAQKGRRWLHAAIEEKVGHVREIVEQYRRRSERREAGWVTGSWRKHPKLRMRDEA
ncbi:MAG TPA: creatininase family protein [Anaerolineae bacterium]|nr:creatininase family protein [Anaerolineae bacterium]